MFPRRPSRLGCFSDHHEIITVARIVHYLKQSLVGKTIAKVHAQVDENVYGKVGCTAQAFEKALSGKKVLDAKQQGKYFW